MKGVCPLLQSVSCSLVEGLHSVPTSSIVASVDRSCYWAYYVDLTTGIIVTGVGVSDVDRLCGVAEGCRKGCQKELWTKIELESYER